MSSRFNTPRLHQRSDPRNTLFERYQPAHRVVDKKSRTFPDSTERHEIDSHGNHSESYTFGYRGNDVKTWSENANSGSSYKFRPATPNTRGQYSEAVLSSLESQNDNEIEGIMGKVRQLKTMTIAIGDEIRDSAALADMINENFEGAHLRLRGTMSRMLVMAQKTGIGWKVWILFFMAVTLIFWWVKISK